MCKEKIQVFIMTRNRPKTVVLAIQSVLSQSYPNIELIVSDNSSDDETLNILSSYKGLLRYVKREPSFENGVDHLNTVIKEVSAKYFMIFHDDDEMLPVMVQSLYEKICESDKYVAVGSNAYAVKGGKSKLMFAPRDSIIEKGEDLIDRYVNSKVAPFPSYMYNSDNIKGVLFDAESKGGKYADVSFLFDILSKGPIAYVGKPLMKYYFHPGQDSANYDFLKRMQLVNYLLRNITDKARLTKFRLYSIYRNIVNDYKDGFILYRPQVIRLFIKHSSYSNLVKYFVRLLQNRLRLCTK